MVPPLTSKDRIGAIAASAIGLSHDGKLVRSLTSAVLAHLRAEILSCRLRPGEKLLIAGLAKRFGVSLSAVREALSRLVAEDLVRAEDQRGFRVSPVSLEALRDITRTRIELETIALRRSIALGDARWEERIRAADRQLSAVGLPRRGDSGRDFEAWRAFHHEFHLAVLAACGSEWLIRLRNILYEQSERYRFLSYTLSPRDVEGEHRAILDATLARDADGAVTALADHLELTARIIAEGNSEALG